MIWLEVWSSVSTCACKECRVAMGKLDESTIQASSQKRQITILFQTTLTNLTRFFKTQERSWRFQWNQQSSATNKHASRPPRHRARSVRISKVYSSQKAKSFTENHVANQGFESWHHFNLVHTPVFTSAKIAVDKYKLPAWTTSEG